MEIKRKSLIYLFITIPLISFIILPTGTPACSIYINSLHTDKQSYYTNDNMNIFVSYDVFITDEFYEFYTQIHLLDNESNILWSSQRFSDIGLNISKSLTINLSEISFKNYQSNPINLKIALFRNYTEYIEPETLIDYGGNTSIQVKKLRLTCETNLSETIPYSQILNIHSDFKYDNSTHSSDFTGSINTQLIKSNEVLQNITQFINGSLDIQFSALILGNYNIIFYVSDNRYNQTTFNYSFTVVKIAIGYELFSDNLNESFNNLDRVFVKIQFFYQYTDSIRYLSNQEIIIRIFNSSNLLMATSNTTTQSGFLYYLIDRHIIQNYQNLHIEIIYKNGTYLEDFQYSIKLNRNLIKTSNLPIYITSIIVIMFFLILILRYSLKTRDVRIEDIVIEI